MACRGWLDAEVAVVSPHVIVCLGATAAQSFMGRKFLLTKERGELQSTAWAPHWMATWHPSAVLRAPDPGARDRMRGELIADLRRAYAART
jgi:DNA polymerase